MSSMIERVARRSANVHVSAGTPVFIRISKAPTVQRQLLLFQRSGTGSAADLGRDAQTAHRCSDDMSAALGADPTKWHIFQHRMANHRGFLDSYPTCGQLADVIRAEEDCAKLSFNLFKSSISWSVMIRALSVRGSTLCLILVCSFAWIVPLLSLSCSANRSAAPCRASLPRRFSRSYPLVYSSSLSSIVSVEIG